MSIKIITPSTTYYLDSDNNILLSRGNYSHIAYINDNIHLDSTTYTNINELYTICKTIDCDILNPVIRYNNELAFFGDIHKTLLDSTLINLTDEKQVYYHTKKTDLIYKHIYICKKEIYEKINEIDNTVVNDILVDTGFISYVTPYVTFNTSIHITYINNSPRNYPIKEYYRLIETQYPITPIYCNSSKILIIEETIITGDKDCGSKYMLQFIISLIRLNQTVDLISKNALYHTKYSNILKKLGCMVVYNYPYNIKRYLMHNSNTYKSIILSRFELGQSLYFTCKICCPKSVIILFTHDISHLRTLDSNRKTLELSLIKKVDLSIICSTTEMDYLYKYTNKLFYLPICYNQLPYKYKAINTTGLYFIGSTHTPNIEALDSFIISKFKHLKNIKLHLYGECSFHYINIPNIVVHGCIADELLSTELLKRRINIAPLISGAGIKGKILEAMTLGIPTITNLVGINGFVSINKYSEDILIIDNDDPNYTAKLEHIYNNIAFLDKISLNGYNYITKYFSMAYFNKQCNKLIDLMDTSSNTEVKSVADSYANDKYNIAILIVFYNNTDLIENYINYFESMDYYISFSFYIITNKIGTTCPEYIKAKNNIYMYEYNNEHLEYGAIQSCIDELEIYNENYDAYLITNDTFQINLPLTNGVFLNYEMFLHSVKNICAIGNIDTFPEVIKVADKDIHKWIRGNFILLHKTAFGCIKDNIVSYTRDIIYNTMDNISQDNLKIEIGNYENIISYISRDYYTKTYPTIQLLQKKVGSILNEYNISHILLENNIPLINFEHLQSITNNQLYKDQFDKIPVSQTRWVDFDTDIIKCSLFDIISVRVYRPMKPPLA